MRLCDELEQVDELVSNNCDRRHAAPFELNGVVDTPRRTTPSVGQSVEDRTRRIG